MSTSAPVSSTDRRYAENPVVVRFWRGEQVESQHRGSWVLVDGQGSVLDGRGDHGFPVYARSTVKCLQALPLVETGAADRFGFTDAELALALASHSAEPCHTEIVAGMLEKLGLSEGDLRCGAHPPQDPDARRRLRAEGREPTAIHNNCSGKHAGFLALALHLGVPPARYLDPESEGQRLVREAVLAMTGVGPSELTTAVDGCSAPTFRLPLRGLATAFARVASPEGLPAGRRAACERMLGAVAARPELIAGNQRRICTDIVRASRGHVFPKIGGDAVYAIGARDEDRGLAVKVDDGGSRGLHPLVVDLLRRFEFVDASAAAALASWEEPILRNWAGLEVGRTEVLR